MAREKICCFTITAFIIAIATSISPAADSEHWNDVGVSHRIDSNISLSFSDRMKFREIPFGRIYIASGKAGLGYATRWKLFITPSYRIDWIDKDIKDEYEHRYSLQLDYRSQFREVKITGTQITELRYFTGFSKDHVRLRLRLNLSRTLGRPADLPLSVYAAPEIFYDNVNDEISRLRIYAGLDLKAFSNAIIRMGYILQNEKGKPDVHLFNTGISLSM